MARPSHPIRRLLASLEACAAEETGLIGQEDWAALAELFVRELVLLHRLAHEKQRNGQPLTDDAELQAQVEALQRRYAHLNTRLAEGQARLQAQLAALDQTGRRVRAVRGAYHLSAA